MHRGMDGGVEAVASGGEGVEIMRKRSALLLSGSSGSNESA